MPAFVTHKVDKRIKPICDYIIKIYKIYTDLRGNDASNIRRLSQPSCFKPPIKFLIQFAGWQIRISSEEKILLVNNFFVVISSKLTVKFLFTLFFLYSI